MKFITPADNRGRCLDYAPYVDGGDGTLGLYDGHDTTAGRDNQSH